MKATGKIAWATALVLALAMLAVPRAARAQSDVRNIPPNVLLILDTSSSMEYLQHEHMIPKCKNDPLEDDPEIRTRWMMALDALLGPISDETFHCEFTIPDDYEDRMVPHFVAKGTRDTSWGILERYRELVRFGFSTFDSFADTDDDLDGMWSYGSAPQSANYGIKRPQTVLDTENIAGALISFGADDENYELINIEIREEVEETIPYCGSPVAAALDDAEYFFTTHPDNIAFSQGGNDHYAMCRQQFAILITDGMPNAGEGAYGYGTSPMEAADLWSLDLNTAPSPYDNVPLYVIGFSICPEGTTDGDLIRDTLNQIANTGCPSDQVDRCPAGAYFADDTYELMAALDELLEKAVKDANSRTLPVTTNLVGEDAAPNVVQYQFLTSFEVGAAGVPWKGHLERVSYVCPTTFGEPELSTTEYLHLGAQLDSRIAPRGIFTYRDSDGDGQGDTKVDFDATEIDQTDLGRPSEDATWVQEIVDFIHGKDGSPRDPETFANVSRLADPFHASAAILEPPLQDLPLMSYYAYRVDKQDRPPVIFLATNEGLVHAFRVQDTGTPEESGEELWAYVPGLLLDKIQRQYPTSHDWNADSTPVVRDIRVFKDSDDDWDDEEWIALLVGGLRQGGRGYYALDVTDPEDPNDVEVLWEIDETTPGFEDMGLTYATPFVSTTFTEDPDNGSHPLGELATVVFPGGIDPVDQDRSTSLYVVSAATGTLIKELSPQEELATKLACPLTPDCSVRPECCAQLVSNPVGFGALPGVATTRIFVGDDRGRIWRADMSSDDPDDWFLSLFYPDPEPLPDEPAPPYLTAESIENPIGLAMNEQGQLVVLFGTGNVDDLPGMAQNYLFSLTEEYSWDSTNSVYLGKARFNYMVEFEPGEKLIGQPIVFDEVAYFSTFLPYTDEEDYCVIGEGRIWGVHYQEEDPNQDGDDEDFAQIDHDEDASTPNVRFLSYDNTLISGLTIVQRPSCMEIDPSTGVDFGGGQQETYELVAQVSGPGGSTQGVSGRQTSTINLKIPAPEVRNFADSWGAVIE